MLWRHNVVYKSKHNANYQGLLCTITSQNNFNCLKNAILKNANMINLFHRLVIELERTIQRIENHLKLLYETFFLVLSC